MMEEKKRVPKFMADINVGKLARLLRLTGYDTLIFKGTHDSDMITLAELEERVVLTRDTQIMKRRIIASGQVKAILIESDEPEEQLRQVNKTLNLSGDIMPFTICLECNVPLVEKQKEDVMGLVPEYVYKTQDRYTACPACGRIYWRGTHWQAMRERLKCLK